MKKQLIIGSFLIFLISYIPLFGQNQQQRKDIFPSVSTDKKNSVQLDRFSVQISVLGNIAITTYDMTFKNSENRVLEGQMEFPLQESEQVIGYQLEVNGKMRKGVVVEKAEARQAYEEVVNRQVDPGIVEKTQGNNYRTRLYPIPANGTKRVIITTQQTLLSSNQKYQYTLPFNSNTVLSSFEIELEVYSDQEPVFESDSLGNVPFENRDNIQRMVFKKQNYAITEPLKFSIPEFFRNETSYFETINNEHFFLHNILIPYIGIQDDPIMESKGITILWDISFSGLNRNIDKELSFIQSVMRMLPDKPIELITFSDRIHQKIKIKPSDFETLKKTVESFIYDGISNLTILPQLPISNNDVVLIFSDGMNGLGQITHEAIKNQFTFAIVSGLNNNYQALNKLSGKNIININNLKEKEALAKIFIPELSLISVEVLSGKFDQIFPSIGSKGSLLIPVCGKMYSESGVIKLNFGIHQKITDSKTIRLNYNSKQDLSLKHEGISTIISRQWAQYQLDELMNELPKSKPEIIDISKKYGIVTSYTSLIVLEDIVDYVRYHIVPPDEVLNENRENKEIYQRYLSRLKQIDSSNNINNSIENIVIEDFKKYYTPLLKWWDSPIQKTTITFDTSFLSNSFPIRRSEINFDTMRTVVFSNGLSSIKGFVVEPGGEPQSYIQVRLENSSVAVNGTNADEKGFYIMYGIPPGTYNLIFGGGGLCVFTKTIDNIMVDSNQIITQNAIIDCANQLDAVIIQAESFSFEMDNSRSSVSYAGSNTNILEEPEKLKAIKIALNKYNPNEPYLKPFTEINSKEELYSLYLQSRKEYLTTPSYFVNMADLFYQKGLRDTAKMILSNILEITNEEYQIVQVYGKKLMEFGFYKEAIAAFQYIVELREEFPQSYRDVALAYEANGDYQKAYDQFLFILTKTWKLDDNIKPVVFTEFNSLLNRYGNKIDAKDLNPKLKAEIPVDIRVVLSWDTDNNDIDLHIIEPDSTKCFYGNRLTRNGGKISQDFTRGFGPEQYMMKNGMDGTYEIKAHYFGSQSQAQLMPVTVYADVYLNYGTHDQTHQRMILKLNDKKETFTIGGIEWNNKGKK